VAGREPRTLNLWEQTGWQRGKSDTATWAQDRPISFNVVPVAVGGGVGVVVATLLTRKLAPWAQVLIWAAGAVVGYFLAVMLVAVVLALLAPRRQRNELRAELSERHSIYDLIEVDRHLRALRDNNRETLESPRARTRTGPLGEDQVPWVRGLNEGLELSLETYGFPELVPQIVLRNPSLSTWEDVRRAARRIDANLTAVLEGRFFEDVRHLREVVAAEAAEGLKGLPSERLSMLREEGVSLGEAAGTRGYGDEIMEAAAQSNEVAKWTLEVEKSLESVAPDLLPEWYAKVKEWDNDSSGADRLEERLELLDGFIVRLRAKEHH
jgi:hypothetical protein